MCVTTSRQCCGRGEAAAAEARGVVLRGAWSPVAAQLDVQVQSVGRRDTETTVVARVPQRVAPWRRPAQVRPTHPTPRTARLFAPLCTNVLVQVEQSVGCVCLSVCPDNNYYTTTTTTTVLRPPGLCAGLPA